VRTNVSYNNILTGTPSEYLCDIMTPVVMVTGLLSATNRSPENSVVPDGETDEISNSDNNS